MKKIIKKINDNKYYLLFAVVIGIFIINYNYVPGDDLIYKAKFIELGLFNFIKEEYLNWSGRLSMIIIPALIKNNLYVWKLLNTLVAFLFMKGFSYYYKPFLSKEDKNEIDKILLVCFFLIFPYTITSTFVWLSGSYQYLWVITAFIYAMIPFYKILFVDGNVNFSKKRWVLIYFAMFCASYIEQEFLVIFVLGTISIVILLLDKTKLKSEKRKIYIYYIFFLINLVIARLSPGLGKRIFTEIRWYPNWENMPFIYRFYEVINITNRHILFGSNLLFLIFTIFLSILIYKKEKFKNKILFLPTLYFILRVFPFDIISNNVMLWYFKIENIYSPIGEKRTLFLSEASNVFLFDTMKVIDNIKSLKIDYLAPVICFFIIIFISFILYMIFDSRKKGILCFLVYWAGFCSIYITAFIPAVHAIGSRVFLLMNSCILFIISQIYLEIKQKYPESDKNRYFKIFIIIVSIYSFLIILNYNYYLKQLLYL